MSDGAGSLPEMHAGYCAIIGLPNVGKSTLINHILGAHMVAVSNKPQTTRDRFLGVCHLEPATDGLAAQLAFVDTPGLQDGHGPLRRYMRDEAVAAAEGCDVALLVVDASDGANTPAMLNRADGELLRQAIAAHPTIVALNKADAVAKPTLLPLIEAWAKLPTVTAVFPISALQGEGVAELIRDIAKRLPVGPALFPDDMVTDRPEAYVAAELIREQLYHQLGKELPYAAAVQIEKWEAHAGRPDLTIHAVIVVERDSQKAIVVGKAGSRIRELGHAARLALSASMERPVHLRLFVKVTSEWSRGELGLRKLGYAGAAPARATKPRSKEAK